MLLDPLHPAVVHFPLVLAMLLPLFVAGSLWVIRGGVDPVRGWALPVALAAALAGSAWLAVETGEAEEDAVERAVPEEALHEHEEAGERLLLLSAALLVLAGGGLLRGPVGTGARYATALGTLVVAVAAVDTGEAGASLVYRHGAASVYVTPAAVDTPGEVSDREHEEEEGD